MSDTFADIGAELIKGQMRQKDARIAALEARLAEVEADAALVQQICDMLGIGAKARNPSIILTCISNSIRRSDCLSRIEQHHSTQYVDEDGEDVEESLLNWGESPEEYIETYKAAIDAAREVE